MHADAKRYDNIWSMGKQILDKCYRNHYFNTLKPSGHYMYHML
jgi:hypothetical protein